MLYSTSHHYYSQSNTTHIILNIQCSFPLILPFTFFTSFLSTTSYHSHTLISPTLTHHYHLTSNPLSSNNHFFITNDSLHTIYISTYHHLNPTIQIQSNSLFDSTLHIKPSLHTTINQFHQIIALSILHAYPP